MLTPNSEELNSKCFYIKAYICLIKKAYMCLHIQPIKSRLLCYFTVKRNATGKKNQMSFSLFRCLLNVSCSHNFLCDLEIYLGTFLWSISMSGNYWWRYYDTDCRVPSSHIWLWCTEAWLLEPARHRSMQKVHYQITASVLKLFITNLSVTEVCVAKLTPKPNLGIGKSG